jgi:hypothetical protein
MEPFDALSLCAEVTIAILGFSGIVVVLDRHSHESASRGLFYTLFRGTLIPLLVIAIASILDAAGLERANIWRTCSAIHAVALCVILVSTQPASRRASDFSHGMWIPLVGAIAVLGLSIWNALSHHSFWPVLTVVWWAIGVSLFAFVSLIFSKDAPLSRTSSDSGDTGA